MTDMTVFIAQDQRVDVIEMRDWLHNPDNNTNGYRIIGCYDLDGQRATLTGLKFSFPHACEAAYFRLRWVSATKYRMREKT